MPRYTLKVVTDFAAAHRLNGYPGDCSRLHGHNWKLEIEVTATALDAIGMGVDFKVIKSAARSVTDNLDHYDLNALAMFENINPTAENIAAYVYRELTKVLDTETRRVSAVTLWETDRACVRYTEED
jgi:6-pyruvoyltetrahydropterin/6-carboxytetrahydropterin synthase